MSEDSGCIVVGAGLAADNVVESLRENGFDAPITLIGDELDRPYERPPLSKDFLQGKADRDSVYVHDQAWYDEHDISTRFGDTVASIDRAAHTVTLASGDVIAFGGPARLAYHGIDRIRPGTSPLVPGGGRLSLTLRHVQAG